MQISNLFDQNAFFRSTDEIRSSITKSNNYQNEPPEQAQVLMIFSTTKQRTYLVATPRRLYCILDDTRKDHPHVNWSMSEATAAPNGEPILDIVTRGKTDKIGLVDISSSHKNWMFTKRLFKDSDITTAIKNLVSKAMGGNQ